jgi:Transposase DDE domain group 1
MKKDNEHTDLSGPQSVTDFIKVQTGQKTIQIGFTDQRVSPYAGLATFAGFLHWHRIGALLAKGLPHAPRSNNALAPADIALGFLAGVLAGAKKLAQVAHLRRDPALAPVLEIERVPSQSTLSRFFAKFCGAAVNLRALDPLWSWGLERLSSRPGGYTLDLDTTQLLHEDSHQCEGVRTGHTPRGLKRCVNPLLGFLAEAKLVIGFWLRPGNTVTFNNVVAFTLAILERLPRHIRIGLVRADSGFCFEPWLQLLEERGLKYIVVGKIYRPVRSLLTRQQDWQATPVPGTEVADLQTQEWSWARARRVVLVRHRIAEKERPGGKHLLEVPGYTFQVLLTNLGMEVAAIEVWRRYNGRAGCENVIKELDAHYGLPQLCLKKFWATEAALGLAIFSYNLCILFQRHLGWVERVSAGTLRFRLFTTGGILSHTGGLTTIRLAVPPPQRAWWRALFEKLLSPFNCTAVETTVVPNS